VVDYGLQRVVKLFAGFANGEAGPLARTFISMGA
jgi:hypothetical protein